MTTFSDPVTPRGSNCTQINVSRNGVPFGIIRKFKDTSTDHSPWQAIPLKGEHKDFWGIWRKSNTKALNLAKEYMMNL